MEVKLLTSPASIKDMENFTAIAALTCHANTEKDYVARDVLERIIKLRHESVLEHITLTYSVKGLSRALLQELARHRHISLSVESTRHTLDKYMSMSEGEILEFFEKYLDTLPLTIDKELKRICSSVYFGVLRSIKNFQNLPNDELKYFLPEFWPTNLILTVNIRELRHIIELRTNPAALEEFRVLAYSLYAAVPEQYRYLLEDCVYKENGHE